MFISTKLCKLVYSLSNSTNSESFIGLINQINSQQSLVGAILVADNHRAHYSEHVKDLLTFMGCEISFLFFFFFS